MIKINTQIIVTFEGYPEERNELSIDLHMQALDFAIKCIKDDCIETITKITKR